jgi:hypothetical protein
MAVIQRPCYATREDVRRALDVQLASYANDRIDRACVGASDDVDGLLQRVFYINDETRYFDWPNFQYAYPWRLWLDADELADYTVNPPVINSGGVIIPNTAVYYGDPHFPNTPPFTYIELNRSMNYSFGNGPTPQREIAITGTYGYWRNLLQEGTLASASGSADSSITLSQGNSPSPGDLVIIDNERMIATDAQFTSTSAGFLSGITTASMADNTGTVSNGANYATNEVILVDSEWMFIQNIIGNTLTVKRAYGGSVLATHADSFIYAQRQLSVLRGQLGTTAATHSQNAPINILAIPGGVKDLAVAYAIVTLTQEKGAYAAYSNTGTTGSGTNLRSTGSVTFGTIVREPKPGTGLVDLEEKALSRYGRRARTRVI